MIPKARLLQELRRWREQSEAVLRGPGRQGTDMHLLRRLKTQIHHVAAMHAATRACAIDPIHQGCPERRQALHARALREALRTLCPVIGITDPIPCGICKKSHVLTGQRLGLDDFPHSRGSGFEDRDREVIEGHGDSHRGDQREQKIWDPEISAIWMSVLRNRNPGLPDLPILEVIQALQAILQSFLYATQHAASRLLLEALIPKIQKNPEGGLPNLEGADVGMQAVTYMHRDPLRTQMISGNPAETGNRAKLDSLDNSAMWQAQWEPKHGYNWQSVPQNTPSLFERALRPPELRCERECAIHRPKVLEGFQARHHRIGSLHAAKRVLSYRRALKRTQGEAGNRLRRVLESPIPKRHPTLGLPIAMARALAETERRTQFAEHHPEQVADWIAERLNRQEVQALLGKVEQNQIGRDPLAPSVKTTEILELYVLLKKHQRLKKNGLLEIPWKRIQQVNQIILRYGEDRILSLYHTDPHGAKALLESLRLNTTGCLIPEEGDPETELKDSKAQAEILIQAFRNLSPRDAVKQIQTPFWHPKTKNHGNCRFTDLGDCTSSLAHTLALLEAEPATPEANKIQKSWQRRIRREMLKAACGPARIRDWIVQWHDIQTHPGKRLESEEENFEWDPPKDWDRWRKHPEGGIRYPHLTPVLNSQDLQQVGDLNRHCIRSMEHDSSLHILVHPLKEGENPLTTPCATIVISHEPEGGALCVGDNLGPRNRSISKKHPSWKAAYAAARILSQSQLGQPGQSEQPGQPGQPDQLNREIRKMRILGTEERRERIRNHYWIHLRRILPKQIQALADQAPGMKKGDGR